MAHRFKNKKKGRNHVHENKPAGIVQQGRRDPGAPKIVVAPVVTKDTLLIAEVPTASPVIA